MNALERLLGRQGDPTTRLIQVAVIVLADLLSFAIALVFGFWAVQAQTHLLASLVSAFQVKHLIVYAFLVAAWLFWFGLVKQAYKCRKPFWTDLWQLFTAIFAFFVAGAALGGVFVITHYQDWFLWACLSLLVLLPVGRHISKAMLRHWGLWCIPTVIIGHGDNAKEAYLALNSEPDMGFKVLAFVAFADKHSPSSSTLATSPLSNIPLVSMALASAEISNLQGYQCVVALDTDQNMLCDSVIRLLNHNQITDLYVIPTMRGLPLDGMETANFFSHEVLLIQLRNNSVNPLHRACKRIFDIVVSATLLLLLSPLLMLLAYKVSQDGGSAIFGHTRVGSMGVSFKCYKFRSMVINAQEVLAHLLATDPVAKAEWDLDFKLKNDPRVNKLGEFMRRTSLDELPQLFNVLRGDMSLVGPRPVVKAELERYGDDVDYYLMVRPGITGLWQVSGRNDVDYATRVYLDAWYVKNWSLWTDIAILFKTISVVFERKGAY